MNNALYYTPSDELGEVAVGDAVQVMDRDQHVVGAQRITRIGKTHVVTDCGRCWTKQHGECLDTAIDAALTTPEPPK